MKGLKLTLSLNFWYCFHLHQDCYWCCWCQKERKQNKKLKLQSPAPRNQLGRRVPYPSSPALLPGLNVFYQHSFQIMGYLSRKAFSRWFVIKIWGLVPLPLLLLHLSLLLFFLLFKIPSNIQKAFVQNLVCFENSAKSHGKKTRNSH